MTPPLLPAAWGLAGLAAICVGLGVRALRRARPLRLVASGTFALLFAALAALAVALSAGLHGYRALLREELAAVVEVRPQGPQRFLAVVRLPDGAERRLELRGDELYVDAHILKWRPVANLLGLHTAYELDRVSGRYAALADERDAPRTVYALGQTRSVDLFRLVRRFPLLDWLVDAEYGSATFIMADRPARFEVRVSTTGLLIRERGGRAADWPR